MPLHHAFTHVSGGGPCFAQMDQKLDRSCLWFCERNRTLLGASQQQGQSNLHHLAPYCWKHRMLHEHEVGIIFIGFVFLIFGQAVKLLVFCDFWACCCACCRSFWEIARFCVTVASFLLLNAVDGLGIHHMFGLLLWLAKMCGQHWSGLLPHPLMLSSAYCRWDFVARIWLIPG